MSTTHDPGGAPELDEARRLLHYRGWRFRWSAQRTATGLYRPVAELLSSPFAGAATGPLPDDTEEIAYATEAEALRHAQQQAIRWVHDRTGDGQGQF